MASDDASTCSPRLTSIHAVERSLDQLGKRARRILLAQRLALLLAAAAGVVIALGAADYFLRLPALIRWMDLAIGVGLIAWVIWRRLAPAVRLRPTLATVALRVERRQPGLAGLLASGVEFDTDAALRQKGADFEQSLALRVVADAASRFNRDSARGLLRLDLFAKASGLLLAAIVGAAMIALARPDLAAIGAQRTLTPWSAAHWPQRTMVSDMTRVSVHPLGAALPLQAALTRTNRAIDKTDVYVEHRPVRAGEVGAVRRDLMTWQRREVETDANGQGELFERLIDADADAIEYRFVTSDDRTDWSRVRLVPPPMVASARAVVSPPAYARAIDNADGALTERVELDLGDGSDERAVAPPALAGSRVELELDLNKPIPASPGDSRWLAATLGVDPASAGLSLSVDPTRPAVWRLAWTLDDPLRLSVVLRDEFGIESTGETVFRFQSVQDRPATATITTPASDMTALATAVVKVVAEGRDDVGLSAVSIHRQRVRPAGAPGAEPSGPGGAVEPVEEPVEIIRRDAAGAASLDVATTLDLAPIGLRPGDQLWLTAIADDVYAIEGVGHEPSRSAVRVLHIITEAEFIDEVRSELASIRQGAIRLHEKQQALRDLPADEQAGDQARREQAQLTERIGRLDEQLGQVSQRVDENALNDRQLANVLDDAQRFLQEAGRWSQAAGDRQEKAQPKAPDKQADQPDPEKARQIDDAQQRVQDELAGLAELLDAGEDAWVMKRQLQSLVDQQADLQRDTQKAGLSTVGKSAQELDQAERSELDRIVDKQLELAQKAQKLSEDLEDRARDLADHDPAAAAGMKQAARRAKESQVSQKMQQAADQAKDNQMAAAGQQQQQAVEDLQQMLDDLDQAEHSRDEVLRRVLASLIQSLESLIAQQRAELKALAGSVDRGVFTGLDQGMIGLNQNTLGALDQASAAGRELAPVADLIGRAVEAQTQAIVALRAQPVEAPTTDAAERRSLDLLQQARDEAAKIDQRLQKRQQDRARRELRQAYRDALEEQVAIRADTADLARLEQLDRRQRASSRKLSQQESELQSTLNGLLEKTAAVSDAAIFTYAHHRLDELTGRSSSSLADAEPRVALGPMESAVAILQGLVEALREVNPPQDEFAKGAGGGGGGGGSGGPKDELIPPLAELRLLKEIQTDLARRTRSLADAGGDPDKASSLGDEQRELGELGEDLVRRMKSQQSQEQEQPE